MTVEAKDWRGNLIEVGSRVVYPGRYSSSLWMIEGEVVDILEEDAPYSWSNPKTRPVLKVRRIRESGRRGESDNKVVKVAELGRVTVVDAA